MLKLTFLSLVSGLTSSLTLGPLKQGTQKERCPKTGEWSGCHWKRVDGKRSDQMQTSNFNLGSSLEMATAESFEEPIKTLHKPQLETGFDILERPSGWSLFLMHLKPPRQASSSSKHIRTNNMSFPLPPPHTTSFSDVKP